MSSRGRGERGSATVEFALVLPLVLVVLLAVVQLSLVLRDRLALSAIAREVAREAAVGGVDPSAPAQTLPGAQVEISREPGVGAPVRVTVSYRSRTDLPVAGWLIPAVDMQASAVMRQESGNPV